MKTCAEYGLCLTQIAATSGSVTHDFAAVATAAVPCLDNLAEIAGRRSPSRLERYLLGRLQGESATPLWLDGMPFYAAARVSEVVGAIALFGPEVRMPPLTHTAW